ncbi:hypothetical protein SLEP1_g28099 [Rubroshorea leprosula]|uniref:Uncharacterized protein n=1 Tax=Rubroshorea leprosula TaxID=152421 RepID=A0AAV5K3G4_9ROSI|nr:hypothetical protein SLEP1_g28099 [Rubroshorea leprosula]
MESTHKFGALVVEIHGLPAGMDSFGFSHFGHEANVCIHNLARLAPDVGCEMIWIGAAHGSVSPTH